MPWSTKAAGEVACAEDLKMHERLKERLAQVREFLSLSPTEQQNRIETEYRDRAPNRDSAATEQIAWHLQTLEEQLSHLSGLLFAEYPPTYSIERFAGSIAFTATQLCIEYISPVIPKVSSRSIQILWNEVEEMVGAIHRHKGSSFSAVHTYRTLYLSVLGLSWTFRVERVIAKGLTDAHIDTLSSIVGRRFVRFDDETLSAIATEMAAERAKFANDI